MSGFSGFGGFGANQQQQQQQQQQQPSSGFGGFGAANTGTSGFGSANTNTGFGSTQNTGTGLFGSGGGNTNTTSGFGGFGGGSTSSGFGNTAKPAFGSTSGTGSLFGGGNTNNTSTTGATGGTGFGGFGSNTAAANTTSTFGGTGSTGGMFGGGAAKPFGSTGTAAGTGTNSVFGSTAATGFGGGAAASTGFGSTATTGGFAANSSANQANQGTAGTQFTPTTEKDGASGNVAYQTITFMPPYQNFSLEELRLVDYNQGRRYGNQGSFGGNTGFGGVQGSTASNTGFGSTGTGSMFGGGASTTTTNQPFGGAQTTGTGLGGGLFGGSKPATGMFGGGAATTSASTTGGLFGTAGTTGGGFGSGGSGFGTTGTTGGGLSFGSNANAQQKPLFGGGGFGSTGASTGTGFGQANNTASTGGGLFGGGAAAPAPSGFGTAGQTQTTSGFGGGFGAQNQTQPQAGGGLFGFGQNAGQQQQQAQQPKPSMFGASTTTAPTSLFGQGAAGTQQAGNTLGGQQAGGLSLFAPKSTATATSGLFGTAGAGTGQGLFGGAGAAQPQQNQGSSLFGGAAQQQPKSMFGSLGASTNNNPTGLFGGGNSTTQPGSSLFGGQAAQQPTLGASFLGSSQQAQQATPSFTASLNDNPYGNDLLFQGLASSTNTSRPLATPLSSSQRAKKNSVLPQHKINPAASSRLITPQKRPQGFGFSYSTYGTPGSAMSNASPSSFGGSLLGTGGFSRSLSKSFSTSNLRSSAYSPESSSILAPGAFSATGPRFSGSQTGSMKRLNIDRNLTTRPSLFGNKETVQPSPLKKTVSFDASASGGNAITNGTSTNGQVMNSTNGALMRLEENQEQPSPPQPRGESVQTTQKAEATGSNKPVANGEDKELLQLRAANAKLAAQQKDMTPGPYWSRPSIAELQQLSPQQLKAVKLIVGREGLGEIEFISPVDLTGIPLDGILGGVVCFLMRLASVYGETSSVPKASQGKGLNVPAILRIHNSWPRSRGGKAPSFETSGKNFDNHLRRLKRVPETTFMDFDSHTGTWIFRVEHFSSYGLDYDDYSDDDMETSMLSPAMLSPTPKGRTPRSRAVVSSPSSTEEMSIPSPSESNPDDTFDFKKRKLLPGGFDGDVDNFAYEEADASEEQFGAEQGSESFLDDGSVVMSSAEVDQDFMDDSASDLVLNQEQTGSLAGHGRAAEPALFKVHPVNSLGDSIKPKSILKQSRIFSPPKNSPARNAFVMGDDWADQLQRTVSPKKQDRTALREDQASALRSKKNDIQIASEAINESQPFTTSIDLMKSLFGPQNGKKTGSQKQGDVGRGIKFPFERKPKAGHNANMMDEKDQDFHKSSKPHWTTDGRLIHTSHKTLLPGDIESRVSNVLNPSKLVPDVLRPYLRSLDLPVIKGPRILPDALEPHSFYFDDFLDDLDCNTPAGKYEHTVWELAHLLFDEVEPDYDPSPNPTRKRTLMKFWEELVHGNAQKDVTAKQQSEYKALAHLSGHNLVDAVLELTSSKNLHLATLVAQINSGRTLREDVASQIEEWNRVNMTAEIPTGIRAIYELVAGNCTISEGKTGGGPENRAPSFKIASHLDLDWRRAFGLRLWYGTFHDEPLALAVAQYCDDLREGREDVRPIPWFIEQSTNGSNPMQAEDQHEDLLWGLLKLYASQEMQIAIDLGSIFEPAAVSGDPLDARLSWQLFQLLLHRAKEGGLKLPTNGRSVPFDASDMSVQQDPSDQDALTSLSDKLTMAYASTLHSPDHFMTALYVYAHLSQPEARELHIRNILCQYAKYYETTTDDEKFKEMSINLGIPDPWIHSAKALYARTVLNDRVQEVYHLLEAGEWSEAHESLCRSVAPQAVINNSLDELREILGQFERVVPMDGSWNGSAKIVKDIVPGWSVGGEIYFDYIHLVDMATTMTAATRPTVPPNEWQPVLSKTMRALNSLASGLDKKELIERVALVEMSGQVAQWTRTVWVEAPLDQIMKRQIDTLPQTLVLPLTSELRLRQARDLALMDFCSINASS